MSLGWLTGDLPLMLAYDDPEISLWDPFSYRRSRNVRPRDWTQVLDMRRFEPPEIQVKVEGGKVCVSARHEDVSGENHDSYETKRVLNVPDDVDKSKLTTRVTDGRLVVVTAPYLKKEEDKTLPKLPTSAYEVVESQDGKKEFQLKVDMGDFTDKDLTIRTSDNTVYIDGEKEWEHEGMKGMQKFHRQFAVPGVGDMTATKAVRDDKGMLTVRIPLKSETQIKGPQTIPIEQAK